MMLMKRNCTSGYLYVAAFGGTAVLNPWKSRVGRWFISFLWPGLFFRGEPFVSGSVSLPKYMSMSMDFPDEATVVSTWYILIHLTSLQMNSFIIHSYGELTCILTANDWNEHEAYIMCVSSCSMRFWNILTENFDGKVVSGNANHQGWALPLSVRLLL